MGGRAVCMAKFRELLTMKTLLIAGLAGVLAVAPGTAIAAADSAPGWMGSTPLTARGSGRPFPAGASSPDAAARTRWPFPGPDPALR